MYSINPGFYPCLTNGRREYALTIPKVPKGNRSTLGTMYTYSYSTKAHEGMCIYISTSYIYSTSGECLPSQLMANDQNLAGLVPAKVRGSLGDIYVRFMDLISPYRSHERLPAALCCVTFTKIESKLKKWKWHPVEKRKEGESSGNQVLGEGAIN